ncbi:TIGR04255 family protein [Caballeronia sp. dw_276]|uniref:TIGR04255 family protein n=1 Tax=Caballeronia sp. dw_276 TaxID=2719795 RepID=UPI001BD25CE5|nr:TIGR04255 family protein [Caballeronia sp. dw_276]
MKLPIRLKSEPIVDAIFEIRFAAKTQIASILPGYLYSTLGGTSVERLSAADIPEAIRVSDANLRALPTQKVFIDKFYILVGDELLGIGCQLPYPGWAEFRPVIEKVLNTVHALKLVLSVHRYSMKYVDVLPAKDSGEALSMLDLGIELGGQKLKHEKFQLRTELVRGAFIHVVNLVGSAQMLIANQPQRNSGAIVDIDSICDLSPAMRFESFLMKLKASADEIHEANKELFFELLQQETVNSLGPDYE